MCCGLFSCACLFLCIFFLFPALLNCSCPWLVINYVRAVVFGTKFKYFLLFFFFRVILFSEFAVQFFALGSCSSIFLFRWRCGHKFILILCYVLV